MNITPTLNAPPHFKHSFSSGRSLLRRLISLRTNHEISMHNSQRVPSLEDSFRRQRGQVHFLFSGLARIRRF